MLLNREPSSDAVSKSVAVGKGVCVCIYLNLKLPLECDADMYIYRIKGRDLKESLVFQGHLWDTVVSCIA